MTILWFIIWVICNAIGTHEPLTFDPVNGWAGALILAVALDLGRQHARGVRRARKQPPGDNVAGPA